MIDQGKAKEAVMNLNKKNLDNLLCALSVEKYIFEIFGNMIDTKYSPETSAMMVRYFDPRLQAEPNLLAAIKRAMPESPSRVQRMGARGEDFRTHLAYPGGLSIVLAYSPKENYGTN
jgi:hypothetical protein